MVALFMLLLMMAIYKIADVEHIETVIYEDEWYEYPPGELMELYYREGNFLEALEHEDWALWEIMGNGADARCRLNAMLGGSYIGLGLYKKGKTYIDDAWEEYEIDGETGESVYIVCYIEGIYYLETGEYETAIRRFKKAVRHAKALKGPGAVVEMDIARICCDMGRAYMELGDMESALKLLKMSYGITGERRLESEAAYIYYYEVLEPVIKESFAKISREEMEFDEWFSVQFGEQGMRQEGDIYDS